MNQMPTTLEIPKSVSEMTVTASGELAEAEVKKFFEYLENFKKGVVGNLEYIASRFARLSPVDFKAAVKSLRGFISSDNCERLRMYGKGKMPAYLALKPKSVTAGFYGKCTPKVREQIAEPDRVVPVATPTGVVHKTLETLSPVEFIRVVDAKKGMRTPEQQYKNWSMAAKTKTDAADENAYEFEKIIPSNKPGYVIIVGKDGANLGLARIRVPVKAVSRLAK